MSQQQPYDSSIKAIFSEDATTILPLLLPGVEVLEVLDTELLRPPMRTDRVYRVRYRGMLHVFDLEFQTNYDESMAYRLAVYHTDLLYRHRLPVISMVIYLFKTTVAQSPLQETSGTEELMNFKFRVLPLWMLDARQYVAKHAVSMYTLLPMMDHIDANMLLQVIDELIEYFRGNDSKLARRLLWLSVFLKRAETLPPLEKTQVKERLAMFDELLEQDEFVQKQRARAEKEGEVKRARKILISYISIRYPSLLDLAQQRAEKITQEVLLQNIIDRIFAANDEATVRTILSSSSSVA